MSDTDNKAPSREYWLEIWTQNADEDMIEANCYHRKPKHWPKKPHGLQVHVIEKSYADKLQRELDEARNKINQLKDELEKSEKRRREYIEYASKRVQAFGEENFKLKYGEKK